MKQIADWALNIANLSGASYADLRILDDRHRTLATKNGKIGNAGESESLGAGIRVLADGAWGFAATEDLGREGIEMTAAKAVSIARASAKVKQRDVQLAPEKAHTDDWTSPCKIDPFTVSVEQNLELLMKIDAELRSVPGVTLAETNMNFRRYEQWFYSSEGSNIHQTRFVTGACFVAYAFSGKEIMKRSYPNSFGGQFQNKGYELVQELKLLENARRIGEEAVALHTADQCPQGKFTIVLDSSQLGLQIHESIGHPIELDRVLGMEANFAGMSFFDAGEAAHLALRHGAGQRGC